MTSLIKDNQAIQQGVTYHLHLSFIDFNEECNFLASLKFQRDFHVFN